MRLIFLGTPGFALPAFHALRQAGHEIIAVYTQPPRPAGRGQQLRPSPVHLAAEAASIPVHIPVSLKNPETQHAFRAHQADAAIVAAYGLLLPKPILEACPHGCLNIHPSLLPRWRGAAPLQRTLMAGDTHTGVCIMQMDEGLDTGPVLACEPYAIPLGTTAGRLHDALAARGAALLVQTLAAIAAGGNAVTAVPQSAEDITYARKITREDARIDWSQPARAVYCQVLGLNPVPGAAFSYQGESWKLWRAEIEEGATYAAPGTVLATGETGIVVACGEGALRLTELQRPNKRAMTASELLRGLSLPTGTVFT